MKHFSIGHETKKFQKNKSQELLEKRMYCKRQNRVKTRLLFNVKGLRLDGTYLAILYITDLS